jgi:hypothetical protein
VKIHKGTQIVAGIIIVIAFTLTLLNALGVSWLQ